MPTMLLLGLVWHAARFSLLCKVGCAARGPAWMPGRLVAAGVTQEIAILGCGCNAVSTKNALVHCMTAYGGSGVM